MACSKYEYVKHYEIPDPIVPNAWFVVRIDGRNFTEFAKRHAYKKPNDHRGLGLMNAAACDVMADFPDAFIAYGQSDEYSFVFRKETQLWNRRSSKIMSAVVSLFSSSFVMHWHEYFGSNMSPAVLENHKEDDNGEAREAEHVAGTALTKAPTFDARVVCYPADKDIRDYLSWRQVDCEPILFP
eukprot:Selendium_serpulae@DN5518_c0_g1_i2.p2